MEWEEKSGLWEKRGSPGEMWSELSSMRKWLLRSCQVRSEAGAFERLRARVCVFDFFYPTVFTDITKKRSAKKPPKLQFSFVKGRLCIEV